MEKIYLIEKDYQNESLNNLARRLAEYHLAELSLEGIDVQYSTSIPSDNSRFIEIGKLSQREEVPFTVNDLHIINDIFNYNLYFENNNDPVLSVGEHRGTFDCLVSLAAGKMVESNPDSIGLTGNHYIIDISPTAIHVSMGIYKNINALYSQVDIFNKQSVKEFLATCEGSKGFFVISNCFMYIVNSLLYDVKLRLKMQNELIDILANDKIDWYVFINTADGISYPCVSAKELQNKKLDNRFKILPWINQ
jgi:hypothetical protein